MKPVNFRLYIVTVILFCSVFLPGFCTTPLDRFLLGKEESYNGNGLIAKAKLVTSGQRPRSHSFVVGTAVEVQSDFDIKVNRRNSYPLTDIWISENSRTIYNIDLHGNTVERCQGQYVAKLARSQDGFLIPKAPIEVLGTMGDAVCDLLPLTGRPVSPKGDQDADGWGEGKSGPSGSGQSSSSSGQHQQGVEGTRGQHQPGAGGTGGQHLRDDGLVQALGRTDNGEAAKTSTCAKKDYIHKIEVRPFKERTDNTDHPVFYTVCYDTEKERALWTYHKLASRRPTEFSRPELTFDPRFMSKIDPELSMKQDDVTMSQLLELPLHDENLKNLYSKRSGSLKYWARGHLTPSIDAVNSAQSRSTFFYINTVPQWQAINGGNWLQMEQAAVNYATAQKADLDVWTGAEGVVTFRKKAAVGDKVTPIATIFLGRRGQPAPGELVQNTFPAPKFMWKVLWDSKKRAGNEQGSALAMVTINTPYDYTGRLDDANYGKTGCHRTGFYRKSNDWDVSNWDKGYTLCYTVAEFCSKFPFPCEHIQELKKLSKEMVPMLAQI